MIQLTYQGETYTRRNGKWVDSHYMLPCESIQRDLDTRYIQSLDISNMTADEIIQLGDELKRNASPAYSLRFFEAAVEVVDKTTLSFLLPRMTSAYRKTGEPQKAIDILTYASRTYGREMVTVPLLTSAAAAYCDMRDYRQAYQCCRRALGMSNGAFSPELSAVYHRIKKESDL